METVNGDPRMVATGYFDLKTGRWCLIAVGGTMASTPYLCLGGRTDRDHWSMTASVRGAVVDNARQWPVRGMMTTRSCAWVKNCASKRSTEAGSAQLYGRVPKQEKKSLAPGPLAMRRSRGRT